MNSNDKLLVTVDISDKGTGILNYFTDFKGNMLGPEDFAVDGDNVYILNSIDNTVLKFMYGRLVDIYNVGFAQGIMVAAFGGYVYILRNDFSIMRISSSGVIEIMAIYNITSEAVADFMVMGEKVYIVISDITGGTTYEFNFDVMGLDINSANNYHGRIFDENTLYEVQLMPFDNKTGGNGNVIVTDLMKGSTRVILVHTKYFLSGVQYFGDDGKGGVYLKIYESRTNDLYQTIVESRIVLIDAQGRVKYVCGLPDQYKYIVNQEKCLGGQFYSMNTYQNGIEIIMMAKPDEASTREYTSKLDQVTPPSMPPEMPGIDPAMSTTRAQIIKNATDYHNFIWSCTEANLLPLQGWVAPRFVNGPGEYTAMPYCWGGNSTMEEYNMGMLDGGRVGNINSPGPALLPNTYGHDCSGFVGLCWGETQKYSTSTIRNISSAIYSEDLKQGDALDRPFYHIMLFNFRDGWGNYVLYESTIYNRLDRVSLTTRPISSLKNYIPLRYNNVVD